MVEENSGERIKNILVIILAGLGDIILASPAVSALRSKFPTENIAILVFSENDELILDCPYVNEIFVLKKGKFFKSSPWNLKTFFKLRKKKFDIAINLYNIYSFWGAIKIFFMLLVIKPKKSLGRNTDGKGFFYNYKIPERFNDSKHQVERMLEVVGFLGAEKKDKRLKVWFSEKNSLNLDNFLTKNNISKEDFIIGINPGSKRLSWRWPAENFAVLVDKLMNNYRAKVVITGDKNEIILANLIKKLSNREVFISSGQFSLSDLINFIKMCKLYISNDTGPMHIANALGTPLIAIIAGGPQIFYPYIKEKTIVLKKEIDCRPCYKYSCKSMDCLKAISPDEVMNAAASLISKYGI